MHQSHPSIDRPQARPSHSARRPQQRRGLQRGGRVVATCLTAALLLTVGGMSAPGFAKASADEAAAAPYAAVMEKAYDPAEPGAAAIVTRGGEVVYRAARGMADMEHEVALEPDMIFRLGSITKQFTGVAIRLLELEGQLSLDDPLTKFLPDFPQTDEPVTVEQLLAHTSGIKSYTGIPGYMDQEIRRDLTVDELIDVFDDEPIDFAPGERHLYNNSGYVLLGAIIEKVTGKSYAEFLQERIFTPLGMAHTHYDDPEQIVDDRVEGYEKEGDEWRNAPFLSMTQPYAAGSLMSSVDDLARWNRALHGGELMKPEQAKALWTSFTTDDGEEVGYGYGFAIGELRGREMIQHGGGIHGFRTYALYLPQDDVYVAVLANNTDNAKSPSRVAQQLAAIAVGDPFPERKAIELPEETLRRYVGVYRIGEDDTRTVTFADGKLHTQRSGGQRFEILPESETRFFYENTFSYLDFVLGEDGEVSHMLFHPDGAEEAERADLTDEEVQTRTKIEISAEQAAAYAGTYKMQPGFEMTIRVDGNRVFSQLPGQPEVELFAEATDAFFLEVVDAQVTFGREDGAVSTVTIHQGGREMPGEKVE
ncbi:MAG: serine hydrolase [Acidobacteria bacterium]|nr:MAG: serine hydrolase [Acidobacteriota bacterium]REK08517.1 MAG: serine hydrolase [Acidobacteriota bacterium]